MHRPTLSRLALIAGFATILSVGGSTLAQASTPHKTTNVIIACKAHNGAIRIVGSAEKCRRGERVLRWNRVGPRGSTGVRGPAGRNGTAGANGTNGSTLLSGAGLPGATLGNDGDYFLDTSTATLYGPKVAGSWPSTGVAFSGPAGVAGPQGVPGASGTPGAPGAIGPIGPAGAIGPQGPMGAPGIGGVQGPIGPIGATGLTGATGPTGATGAIGPQGPQGNPGPAGAGAILSASSGGQQAATTLAGGLTGNVVVMPLSGAMSQSLPLSGGVLDLSGPAAVGLAQPFPRDATITSIAGYFTNSAALALVGTTVTLSAQLYTSPAPDDIFTAVPGASCTMTPALTGVLAIGTTSNCLTTGLAIPVTANTQAVLVVSADAAGLSLIDTVTGGYSASLGVS